MNQPGIPKRNARLFRITQGVFAVLFGGAAAWMFATSRWTFVAGVFAVAAGVALVDAIVGWRSSRE